MLQHTVGLSLSLSLSRPVYHYPGAARSFLFWGQFLFFRNYLFTHTSVDPPFPSYTQRNIDPYFTNRWRLNFTPTCQLTTAIRLNPTPRREKGEKVTDALPLALPKGGLPRVFLIFLLKSHLCNIFHNQRKRIKGGFSEGPLAVTFALRTCLAPLPAQGNSSHS